jgi:hypothetical protein
MIHFQLKTHVKNSTRKKEKKMKGKERRDFSPSFLPLSKSEIFRFQRDFVGRTKSGSLCL